MCSGAFFACISRVRRLMEHHNILIERWQDTMTIKNQYRDVTLQEISESDIGRELRVAGWVENIRDHGGVSFVPPECATTTKTA